MIYISIHDGSDDAENKKPLNQGRVIYFGVGGWACTCVWLEPVYEERSLAEPGFRQRHLRNTVYALVVYFQFCIGSRRIQKRVVHVRFDECLLHQKKKPRRDSEWTYVWCIYTFPALRKCISVHEGKCGPCSSRRRIRSTRLERGKRVS